MERNGARNHREGIMEATPNNPKDRLEVVYLVVKLG
jgi:hypothetical protein